MFYGCAADQRHGHIFLGDSSGLVHVVDCRAPQGSHLKAQVGVSCGGHPAVGLFCRKSCIDGVKLHFERLPLVYLTCGFQGISCFPGRPSGFVLASMCRAQQGSS